MTWEDQLALNRSETAKLKQRIREARNRVFAEVGLPPRAPVASNSRRMTSAEVAAFKKRVGFREPHGYRLGQQLERR